MKGIPELMEGFRMYHGKYPEWKLRIAGMGKLDDVYSAMPGVEYVGELPYEEVLRTMRDSRVCIFPSKFPEPFGRVIAEAQSVGTLVIGADTGAMPELLKRGGLTTTVEPRSIATAMKKAAKIRDEQYVKRVRASYRFVRQNCSRRVMMEQVQAIYDDSVR